jgi:uncharacterized protein YxjI
MNYSYPLKLRFRLIALAPRISISDNKGQEIFYIEQKVFALREAVKVFNNSKEKTLLYTMKADQILDFGAKYYFRTPNDEVIGYVHQEGMRSLFQASYTVFDKNNEEVYKITQSKPWAALLDSLLSAIPFAELVTGYILNPTYNVTEKDKNDLALVMKKKPSFFEAQFEINSIKTDITKQHELLAILSLLMIVQLERSRG